MLLSLLLLLAVTTAAVQYTHTLQFPNCLPCTTPEEFAANVAWALRHEPQVYFIHFYFVCLLSFVYSMDVCTLVVVMLYATSKECMMPRLTCVRTHCAIARTQFTMLHRVDTNSMHVALLLSVI
jgi:hypothetical protein